MGNTQLGCVATHEMGEKERNQGIIEQYSSAADIRIHETVDGIWIDSNETVWLYWFQLYDYLQIYAAYTVSCHL